LSQLNKEESTLDAEVENLGKMKEQMQNEDRVFWRDVNNYEKNLAYFQDNLS
jgi:hypothetical protein